MITLDEIRNNTKLQEYKRMVIETNEVLNLTAITDSFEFDVKHLYDSLLISDYFDYKFKNIMDLGSGAGFPGIPLAILLKDTNFYLVEPTKKRCDFLTRVKDALNLTNVTIINKRSEDLDINFRGYFDFIVTRAVSRLNILLEISLPFLKTNGYLICYKGIKYQEEINDSSFALKILNSTIEEVKKETLPFLNEERFNIIIKKNKEIDKKYPRLYSIIKKRPL
ncbi:MAG: 16S rRNA (guanine(527)-N(7))-methyltransferase RsmG [Candidatus Onthovivens sp.]